MQILNRLPLQLWLYYPCRQFSEQTFSLACRWKSGFKTVERNGKNRRTSAARRQRNTNWMQRNICSNPTRTRNTAKRQHRQGQRAHLPPLSKPRPSRQNRWRPEKTWVQQRTAVKQLTAAAAAAAAAIPAHFSAIIPPLPVTWPPFACRLPCRLPLASPRA